MSSLRGSTFKQVTGLPAKPFLRFFGRKFPGNVGYNPTFEKLTSDYNKLTVKLAEALQLGNGAKVNELSAKMKQLEGLIAAYESKQMNQASRANNTVEALRRRTNAATSALTGLPLSTNVSQSELDEYMKGLERLSVLPTEANMQKMSFAPLESKLAALKYGKNPLGVPPVPMEYALSTSNPVSNADIQRKLNELKKKRTTRRNRRNRRKNTRRSTTRRN
jgi:hypothetical protein